MTVEDRYNELMGFAGRAEVTRQTGRKLESGSDGAARNGLAGIINSVLGVQTVIPETADSELLKYVPAVIETSLSSAESRLSPEVIDHAKDVNGDTFKANYWLVTPTETGDDNHDAIARAHAPIFGLYKALENFDDNAGVRGSVAFITGTTQFILENVKQRLLAEGSTSNNAIEQLSELVGASYQTSGPERAYIRAQTAFAEGKGRLDAAVDEGDRVDYVANTLNYLASNGQERTAVKDLHKVSTARTA